MSSGATSALPVALITGAHGGMGTACSRVFGRRYRLVITDLDADRLGTLRKQLEDDGAEVVAAIVGDLTTDHLIPRLAAEVKAAGRLGALVHTAGRSPAFGGWEAILDINLMASVRLVDALEPLVEPGSAAVLIASMAGYMDAMIPDTDAIIAQVVGGGPRSPIDAAFRASIPEEHWAGAAYALSKFGVHRLVEDRVRRWAKSGGRIVSISPGMIRTPMGIKEGEKEEVALLRTTAPISRWGTALDIANAAEFLASDLASLISGCDLLVDGGITGATRAAKLAG